MNLITNIILTTMTITTNELDNIQIGLYKNARTTKRSDIIRLIDFLLPLQNCDKNKDVGGCRRK